MNSREILDREFLIMRAKILELAASLDRIERAGGNVSDEAQLVLLQKGLTILCDAQPDHAERVQLLFSREYESDWIGKMDIHARS